GRFYPPCQYGPRASSWPQHATGTFSLTRALNLSASSPSEMAPTFFTSSSSAHISVKALLLGSCGSEPCANCALLAAREPLRSTQAFRPCRSIKPSDLLQQDHYRVCMASRFRLSGVR